MERLTEKIGNTNCVKGCGSNCKYGFQHCRTEDWENCKTIDDVIDKLAEYEDLEEQGRLIKLPCHIGDSIYSVISPEGCASILWKDSTKAPEASNCLKLTSHDLFDLGVIERIIREPVDSDDRKMFEGLKMLVARTFEKNMAVDTDKLIETRYARFRKFGKKD